MAREERIFRLPKSAQTKQLLLVLAPGSGSAGIRAPRGGGGGGGDGGSHRGLMQRGWGSRVPAGMELGVQHSSSPRRCCSSIPGRDANGICLPQTTPRALETAPFPSGWSWGLCGAALGQAPPAAAPALPGDAPLPPQMAQGMLLSLFKRFKGCSSPSLNSSGDAPHPPHPP